MMPQRPASNADYIEQLTMRNLALQSQLREFQLMFSALSLMLADDRGRVRVNKQILNRTEKIAQIDYDTNSKGAIIIKIAMQDQTQ